MNYEVNDNDKSSTFNVALIGINSITSAFVQSLFYHQSKKEKAPIGRGDIGGYDIKSLRFSSAFTVTPSLYHQVGRKLSTFIYDEDTCQNKIVDPVALSSIIEYQGGNPDSDSEYIGMGGQNPTLRMLPKAAKEEDDEGEDRLNVDALRTILSGYTKEGEEFNEYLKADFALISLPNTNEEPYSHFDTKAIIKVLEELGIPFFVISSSDKSGFYESETLPYVDANILGQFSYGTLTRMLMEKFSTDNVNVRHFFHSNKDLSGGVKRVEGYADVEAYGGNSVEISFTMKFDQNLSMSASVFDIVRFLMVSKELNLAGPIKGLNVLYGSDQSIPQTQAEEECQAIADRNLMGLGQYYTPSGNYFIHK